ncbi:thioesterase domain-containing protein [Pseudomonas sp. B21-056]|jgi:hypothetical protein|uniref:thioesterase domain-containing protein n=1 Tax=Pseudomonas sp. B21-056 TaxID=2895495 RepID=UPI0022311F4C|nr:thioesterase domain-containing protein [Pseudomonas sp. B21-056]UZE23121.1 thioesterase domain-containing protein [Pseudomonas sp. B21-056]
MKLLCFPDFVGHPICFSALARALKGRMTVVPINYSDYWPYSSVEVLARRIAEEHDLTAMDGVLGYSFGAYVAGCCLAQSASPRVLLVDPPLLVDLHGLTPAGIAERLEADPQYAYINDLVDAQLVSHDCVHGNILLLSKWQATPLAGTAVDVLLSAGRTTVGLAQALQLDPAQDNRYWCDEQRHHGSIINSPGVPEWLFDPVALPLSRL